MSIFTGERFVPGIEDKKLTIEHMQRYQSIGALVKDKYVIDIACGEGYGSAILAKNAKQVIGMDIDAGAVERAMQNYKGTNLSYQIGNIADIPLEDHSVDVIVSFETIEHVPQELQAQFLKECKRVLKTDGMLVISTPNKEIYSDRYDYHNEFHIHEFYHDEFVAFLQDEFKYVNMYNQGYQVVSIISDCDCKEKQIACTLGEEYSEAGKYYIAVASNCDTELPPISSMYMCEEGEYEWLIQRILTLQNEVEERNLHINKLDSEIENAGYTNRIIELQNDVEERNEHIHKLDAEIDGNRKRIVELQNEVEERNKHIKKLDAEIAILRKKVRK